MELEQDAGGGKGEAGHFRLGHCRGHDRRCGPFLLPWLGYSLLLGSRGRFELPQRLSALHAVGCESASAYFSVVPTSGAAQQDAPNCHRGVPRVAVSDRAVKTSRVKEGRKKAIGVTHVVTRVDDALLDSVVSAVLRGISP